MSFTFETESGEFSGAAESLPLAVKKMITVLDSLEYGRFVNVTILSERAGVRKYTMKNYTTHRAIRPYKIEPRYNLVFFGSRETVEAWKKEEGKKDAGRNNA